MANVTLKKGLVFLILAFTLTFDAVSQKQGKTTEFSEEFSVFLYELESFMTAKNNDQLKSVYKKFLKKI